MTEMPDIPDFLRVTADTPRAPWKAKAKRKTRTSGRRPFHLPKTIEPAGLELLKQIECERQEKTKARLAMLKTRRRDCRST